MTELVVKVLVDAEFYEKCLKAYNESEKKTGNNLVGEGILYHDNAQYIPNTDITPPLEHKSSSSVTILEHAPPGIVPVISPMDDDKTQPKKSPKVIQAKKPRKVIQKSTTTTHKKQSSSTVFKRPSGTPWFYIGLKD